MMKNTFFSVKHISRNFLPGPGNSRNSGRSRNCLRDMTEAETDYRDLAEAEAAYRDLAKE